MFIWGPQRCCTRPQGCWYSIQVHNPSKRLRLKHHIEKRSSEQELKVRGWELGTLLCLSLPIGLPFCLTEKQGSPMGKDRQSKDPNSQPLTFCSSSLLLFSMRSCLLEELFIGSSPKKEQIPTPDHQLSLAGSSVPKMFLD